jgi:hypothetical protein
MLSSTIGFLTLQLPGPDQTCDQHDLKERRITRSGINITDHHQSTDGIAAGKKHAQGHDTVISASEINWITETVLTGRFIAFFDGRSPACRR